MHFSKTVYSGESFPHWKLALYMNNVEEKEGNVEKKKK